MYLIFVKIFFSQKQNRQLIFSPKIQYELAAERSEAASKALPFSKMWSILEIVRTVFAACGGEESPPAKFRNRGSAAPIKTAKEPVKISARTAFNFGKRKFFNHDNKTTCKNYHYSYHCYTRHCRLFYFHQRIYKN